MKLDNFLKVKKVRCVKGCGRHLTVGETYHVLGLSVPNNLVQVENDNGFITEYDFEKFEPVIESAENPLQDMKLTPELEALPNDLKPGKTPITSFGFIDVLKKSASSILTQENFATANPAYCVKQCIRHFGIDGDYQNDGYEWFCSEQQEGFDCEDDMFDALNTIAKHTGENEVNMNGDVYRKCYYRNEQRTVTTCFTREQAQQYIDENRHNLKKPFIYVESFNRNPEMLAVRELLICLAENPTMFDGVMVTEGQLDE